ncbi:CYTH domain-containing protein [Adhaeribacter soli]|uniref:CYTH domain-containing protein n=1 Tax=Adhaeribacter soli TaxID=2607655 RepID=A0A5N1JB76_9BACT|nr:CYTH domain-containing protein [Adhaeribacter soli]KAA9346119.1 CYTH domain-containing protein [Adhaeribacter soli]
MAVEIERKFLVNKVKWQEVIKPEGSYLRQGYLLTDPEKTIRVRVKKETGYLTIKGKNEGATRAEYEYPIPVKDAEELLDKFASACITKVRYEIPVDGKVWEVDEFSGENAGLILAEIELNAEEESFTLPDWVSEEVTHDKRYYNSQLSLLPYKDWQGK